MCMDVFLFFVYFCFDNYFDHFDSIALKFRFLFPRYCPILIFRHLSIWLVYFYLLMMILINVAIFQIIQIKNF